MKVICIGMLFALWFYMLRFVDCCLSVGRFLFAIGLSVFVRFIASDQRLGKNVELLGKINILRMRREREGGFHHTT